MAERKCKNCGAPLPPPLELCPDCLRRAGAAPEAVEEAEELRDIAGILSITADTDGNIKLCMNGILNIAERLERKEKERKTE